MSTLFLELYFRLEVGPAEALLFQIDDDSC